MEIKLATKDFRSSLKDIKVVAAGKKYVCTYFCLFSILMRWCCLSRSNETVLWKCVWNFADGAGGCRRTECTIKRLRGICCSAKNFKKVSNSKPDKSKKMLNWKCARRPKHWQSANCSWHGNKSDEGELQYDFNNNSAKEEAAFVVGNVFSSDGLLLVLEAGISSQMTRHFSSAAFLLTLRPEMIDWRGLCYFRFRVVMNTFRLGGLLVVEYESSE